MSIEPITLVQCIIGLCVAYLIYCGRPLIKRPLHSTNHRLQHTINVNDTRGAPSMDAHWTYEQRNSLRENDTLELSRVSVRPLSDRALNEQVKIDDECFDVLIIGGAAAGLSVAACCEQQRLKYVVIEKNESVSDIWLSRYHRLHLHDIIENCHLPFMRMPDIFPTFPSRKQFAAYLEGYKTALGLNVQTCCLVKYAERVDATDPHSTWLVTVCNLAATESRDYKCKHLVMACGVYGDPKIHAIAGSSQFDGLLIHSSRYTNGTDLGLRNRNVLVVGSGNSGTEIALDLVEHEACSVTLLMRSGQVIIPHQIVMELEAFAITHLQWILQIPFAFLLVILSLFCLDFLVKLRCKIHYGDLSQYGVIVHSKGLLQRLRDGVPPVMDMGFIAAVKDGSIKVVNDEIEKYAAPKKVCFKNGCCVDFDAVIYATGYQLFTSHKHWLNEHDVKLAGIGKEALVANKVFPGSNFSACGLPTLWACYGNLLMIKHASQYLVQGIRDTVSSEQTFKMKIRQFIAVEIVKHVLSIAVLYCLWY